MSPSPRVALLLTAGLLGGCFDLGSSSSGTTDTRVHSDTLSGDTATFDRCGALQANVAVDVRSSSDQLLELLVLAPRVRERHLPATLELSWPQSPAWHLSQVTLGLSDGSELHLAPEDEVPATESSWLDSRAFSLAPGLPPVTELRASFTREDEATCSVVEAVEPEADALGTRVTAMAAGPGGTLWTGTLMNGLVGFVGGPGGEIVHYAGVSSVDPYDPSWPGPQSGLVLAVARQGERGLWLGTATTGVSWFDPGADALAEGDDVWIHLQPPAPDDPDLKELRETVMALAPDGDRGLYVGTLDGLWYLRHDGDPAGGTWTRLADGLVLTVAPRDDGRVLVGFTTVVTAEGLGESTLADTWEQAETPLLVLDTGGTPDDRGDDEVDWRWPGNATGVLALDLRPGGAVVGTDRGLYGWLEDEVEDPIVGLLEVADASLAVTSLADAGDGVWVAARSACDPTAGLLARAQLDLLAEDPVAAVVPVDLAGHGIAPHVSLVRVLDGGDLLVGTLVADTAWRDLTPPDCREDLDPRELSADTWILPVDGSPATPL